MAGKKSNTRKPDWTPPDAGSEFAARVVRGGGAAKPAAGGAPGAKPGALPRKREMAPAELAEGVLRGDRTALGRALTLVESSAADHQTAAQQLLQLLMPHAGNALRIGITGVPGVGKSTFIEAFGLYLIAQGHRVAVLAVDPSSSISRGSILGDKTRMEKLSSQEASFIRPSPSGGTSGGVARKTRESMIVCEAAGFDVILVETIGVGQSEIAVRGMVDFFLLLQIPGAGDELQGIKKGVMELADAVVINKADGENRKRAEAARRELARALHYLPPATPGWETRVFTCSALEGRGMDEIWRVIRKFTQHTRQSGFFEERRKQQSRQWFLDLLHEGLQQLLRQIPEMKKRLGEAEQAVLEARLPATVAARILLEEFEKTLLTGKHKS